MGATDQELVLGFRPGARVETREYPADRPRTQYRVVYDAVAGARDRRPAAWCQTEALAWRAACARLGLRVRRTV